MTRDRTLQAALLFLGLLSTSMAFADLGLEGYVSNRDIETAIDRWSKAQAAYYSSLYEAPLSVYVSSGGSRLLIQTYAAWRLPDELVRNDQQLIRPTVLRDLVGVLNRAFIEEARIQFGSVDAMTSDLLERKQAKVEITEKGIAVGLGAADCHIIPCDPKVCDVKSCASESTGRRRKK